MHPHQLTTVADILLFSLAGNARLTLVSKKTGTRFTYRIRKPDANKPHFVSIMTGPDNESHFEFLGTVFPFPRVDFVRSVKSRIGIDAPACVAFRWFWKAMNLNSMPADLEVWHEGRCGRCGRTLTVPESIARGIGPECAGRSRHKRRQLDPVEHDDFTGLEAEMDDMVRKGEEEEERRRMDRKFGVVR